MDQDEKYHKCIWINYKCVRTKVKQYYNDNFKRIIEYFPQLLSKGDGDLLLLMTLSIRDDLRRSSQVFLNRLTHVDGTNRLSRSFDKSYNSNKLAGGELFSRS